MSLVWLGFVFGLLGWQFSGCQQTAEYATQMHDSVMDDVVYYSFGVASVQNSRAGCEPCENAEPCECGTGVQGEQEGFPRSILDKEDVFGSEEVQNSYQCWHKDLSEQFLDEVLTMTEDDQGNLIVISSCHELISGFDYDQNSCVTKLDSSGNVVWEKEFGWTQIDKLWSVSKVQNTEGGADQFMVVGYTRSSGLGEADAWVMLMDVSGEMHWEEDYGGTKDDIARAVVADDEGGFIIVGNRSGVLENVTTSPWIYRIDSMGIQQWSKLLGVETGGQLSDVAHLGQGEYVAVGNTILQPGLKTRVIVAKFVTNGGIMWERFHSAVDYQMASAVAQDAYKDFFVTGKIKIGDGYEYDGFMLKLNSDGYFVWQKTFGGLMYDSVNAMDWRVGNDLLTAGITRSYGNTSAQMWLSQIDAQGRILFERSFGGAGFDTANAVLSLEDGGMAIAGQGGVYRLNRYGVLCVN